MGYLPAFTMHWKTLFRTKSITQIVQESALGQGDSLELKAAELKKVLGVWDLTAFGIAAILGAGIFSTIGNAAYQGGPAVIFLFIFTAIACAFSAFCYAEFASALPVCGSAYTYAYASYGEILAWVIGWDLLMEYSISNIAVAISWGEYFIAILASYGVIVPKYLTIDFFTARKAFQSVSEVLVQSGDSKVNLTSVFSKGVLNGFYAWSEAPRIFGIPFVLNFPALFVTALVTAVAYFGIRESKFASNILVAIKVAVILLVILLGAFYIHPGNWVPFVPNGVSGVFKGVSSVFFAYIGFDAISTTAEECKNPQRDLPLGMIYSLIICTVLYVLMSLVITGVVHYQHLNVGDPLAYVFGPEGANLPWISEVVAISAVVALFTVLLVFQLGQPRIWMAMSRDGLLPAIFSSVHPRFKTPWFSTLMTGVFVAVPALFMNLTEVTDLTSTGTLFAFALVCGGTLKMGRNRLGKNQKFKTPYINSKYCFPLILLGVGLLVLFFSPEKVHSFFSIQEGDFTHKIPMVFYLIGMLLLGIFSFLKNFSLIPVLGLSTCTYLMTELGITNWIRFGIWLWIGFIVYFFYGFHKSRLNVLQS